MFSLGRSPGSRWSVALLVLVPWVAASIFYVRSLPPQHSAVSVVAVVPENARTAIGDLIYVTASRYTVAMTSTTRLDQISQETGVPSKELQRSVTVDSTPDSANIKVTATSENADTALILADAVADAAVDLSGDTEAVSVEKVAPAVLQPTPLLSSPWLLLAVLLVAGLALALWGAYVVERLRPRVRSDEDVEGASGLPSLAKVPSLGRKGDLQRRAATSAALTQGRTLRLAMCQSLPEAPRQVAFVGVGAARGTATAAYLFARALSAEERVLLVDGDSRSATLSNALPDVPRASLVEVLTDGRLPAPLTTGPGLLLLVQPDRSERVDRNEGADARQLARLLAEAGDAWDSVVLAVPAFSRDGEHRQASVPTRDSVLVVPKGTHTATVRRAVRHARRQDGELRGAVLFGGRSDA